MLQSPFSFIFIWSSIKLEISIFTDSGGLYALDAEEKNYHLNTQDLINSGNCLKLIRAVNAIWCVLQNFWYHAFEVF